MDTRSLVAGALVVCLVSVALLAGGSVSVPVGTESTETPHIAKKAPPAGSLDLELDDTNFGDSRYYLRGDVVVHSPYEETIHEAMLCVYGPNETVLQSVSLGSLNMTSDSVSYTVDVDSRPTLIAVYHPQLRSYKRLPAETLRFSDGAIIYNFKMINRLDDFPYNRNIPAGQCV